MIVLETIEEKKEVKLKQIINTYVQKDIRDISSLRNIQKFNNLIKVLASQLVSQLGQSKVIFLSFIPGIFMVR